MNSQALTIVIDERKRLSQVDESSLLQASRTFVLGQPCAQKVFKDYILSSELFYIHTDN